MVCPVLKPMYYIKNSKPINNEPKSRGVYLPKDASWFDFWTGKRYEGGQTIIAEAPLDIIPLFIKAGAILPLGPKKQYSGEPEDPIELRIYPDSDGSFIIYEDENDTYNYEQNQYSIIPLRCENKEKVLTIGKRSGSFKGMMEKRTFNITIISENKSNGLEPNQFLINLLNIMVLK
jgi:alpha-D-xyloside xylohydrolase